MCQENFGNVPVVEEMSEISLKLLTTMSEKFVVSGVI
jgi:hypothetical protein